MSQPVIQIIGAGMAGSECAWQLAEAGFDVNLYEMRPKKPTFAHQTDHFAEMVCSNSFRSDDDTQNAVGQLHWEMRQANGIIMQMGDLHAIPAGGAMAVDRDVFSKAVTDKITNHPRIHIHRGEIVKVPEDGITVIATGPQTDGAFADEIIRLTGQDHLAFFDAIAPIIHKDSINMDVVWDQSRYDKGDTEAERKAYLNCPMDKTQYEAFIDALLASEKAEFKDWEKDTPYFDGCLPIEVMAERGRETLRFGPMKPVGLTNSHDPETKAYAVVQLRLDNALGTLFNIVGFQTKMKHGAQKQVLRMIPGLEDAEFARLGGIHRNSFINSPAVLNCELALSKHPNIYFAGQISGVEGYVESSAMGLLIGRILSRKLTQQPFVKPPETTAMGALYSHITGGSVAKKFQPMNVNFGLFPPIENVRGGRKGRKERYAAYCLRAKTDWNDWLNSE